MTLVAVMLLGFAGLRARSSAGAGGKPLGEHYLMLVNTAYGPYLNSDKLAQFDQSAYDGIAVAFLHAYEISPVPSPEDMDRQISIWKRSTSKDIWPWVFINRMLGIDPSDKHPYSSDAYFHRIQGADLDDKAGAQSDFLANWKNAIRTARDTHVGGIVMDPEFYNYQNEYNIGELAAATGKKPDEAVDSLRRLGARMADVAADQYPRAVIWFLFTGLTHPDYKVVAGVSYYPAPSYIALGLLDEVAKKHLSLLLISGGEGSLGYCHQSVAQFRGAIAKRATDFSSWLARYRDSLELAGTMTLWSESAAKRGWLKDSPCDATTANTVEDLEPYIELLLQSYRYNWIYGSVDGGYLPFESSASRFDSVIRKAQARSTGTFTKSPSDLPTQPIQ